MKLFIMSDIHGSLDKATKALNAFASEKADYIIILGDILSRDGWNLPIDYKPAEVAALLNKYADAIIAVSGNCDQKEDTNILEFPMESVYSNILCDDRRIFVTHGHIYHEDNMPVLSGGDIFVYGHTHIPVVKKKGDVFIVNPGSITFPKSGFPNSYGVFYNDIVELKDLDGNVFTKSELLTF